jgi:hypothetical protein
MSSDDQLLYETRVRNRQVAVAVAAGVLLMVASVIGLSGPHAKVNELTLGLITDHKRGALDLIAAVINAAASLTIAWTLVFLYRCAKARAPQAPPWIPYVAIAGGVIAAVAGVTNAVVLAIKVHDFVTTGAQTYDEANRLTGGAGLLILQVAAQLAALLLAISFVLISLQAMRVGLLPRFMGYLGMFAGALVLFPIIVVPVVQLYWLVAVGYLISGRWPSGVPPAWRSGKAEPWPAQAEMRARRVAAAEARRGRGGRGKAAPAPQTAPAGDAVSAAPAAESSTRASTSKRKRKRRR